MKEKQTVLEHGDCQPERATQLGVMHVVTGQLRKRMLGSSSGGFQMPGDWLKWVPYTISGRQLRLH